METIFDFIDPFENFLLILSRQHINTADVKYFAAYRDYLQLRSEGYTYYASIEMVSERHGFAIGTLRTKFKVFSQRIKV